MNGLLQVEAEVVALPLPARSCFTCAAATFGERGTFCLTFTEMILDEKRTGAECEAWERSSGE